MSGTSPSFPPAFSWLHPLPLRLLQPWVHPTVPAVVPGSSKGHPDKAELAVQPPHLAGKTFLGALWWSSPGGFWGEHSSLSYVLRGQTIRVGFARSAVLLPYVVRRNSPDPDVRVRFHTTRSLSLL